MWTPYSKLIYYAAARQRDSLRKNERISTNRLYDRSSEQADEIVDRSMPDHRIIDELNWPRKSIGENLRMPKFSRKIQQFLSRPDHTSRQALEELLMAYYMSGFGLQESVMQAFHDYETIDDRVVSLEGIDVLNYATFFWDFANGDPEEQKKYVDRACRRPEIINIYHNNRVLSDVRIDWGVIRDYEAGREMRRLAMINTKIAQQTSRDLRDVDTIENSRAYKHIGQFQNVTVNIAMAANEIGGSEETAVSLNDFFDDMWEEVDSDIHDYREMEAHEMTPEDLQSENEKFMEDDEISEDIEPESSEDPEPETEPEKAY